MILNIMNSLHFILCIFMFLSFLSLIFYIIFPRWNVLLCKSYCHAKRYYLFLVVHDCNSFLVDCILVLSILKYDMFSYKLVV